MAELIKSVKALGEKMTGKEVEGTELVDVVDDIAEKYEGGGQGGGSGSPYILTIYELGYITVGAHLDNGSLIQKHKIIRPRITPYFIDYLEELNISYEDAYKPENKQKLIDLMNKKFGKKR